MRIKLALVGLVLAFTATACSDKITTREEACFEQGGDWSECTSEGRRQALELARIETGQAHRPVVRYQPSYGPVVQGTMYTDYYGDPRYGMWSSGRYIFTDPYSQYAMATNSYLLSAGIGGLAAYALLSSSSRDSWNVSNPGGYTKRSSKATQSYGKDGKKISKKEAKRRAKQSKKARKKNKKALKKAKRLKTKEKIKNKAKGKAKQVSNSIKSKLKPKPKKNNKFKQTKRVNSSYSKKPPAKKRRTVTKKRNKR